MTPSSLGSLWDIYGEVMRLHAHQLLVWAHGDIREELVGDLDEPSKTGLLADAMTARLNEHPDTPDEYLHYTVGDQVPVSPEGQTGNKRLRLDLSLIRSGIRPRLAYIIEAKRLKTNHYPIGEYVGAGGMGDFIEARYATDCPEAAMVALFEDKELSYWHQQLRGVFGNARKSRSSKLSVLEDLKELEVIPDLAGELESLHQRKKSAGPIRLLHLFLDCRDLDAL